MGIFRNIGLVSICTIYLKSIKEKWQKDRIFEPELDKITVDKMRYKWHRALDKSKDWIKHQYLMITKSKRAIGRVKCQEAK